MITRADPRTPCARNLRRDARGAHLEATRYRVLSLWNAEAVESLDGVVEAIFARAAERPPTLARQRIKSGTDSAIPAASGRRVGVSVVAALTFGILAACSFPAYAFEQRQVGAWSLKWAASDGVPYCTIERIVGDGAFAYQALASGRRVIGFRKLRGPKFPGSAPQMAILLDGREAWSQPVDGGPAVIFRAGTDPDPADTIAASRSLSLSIDGQMLNFDLSGFREAIEAQRACLAQAKS